MLKIATASTETFYWQYFFTQEINKWALALLRISVKAQFATLSHVYFWDVTVCRLNIYLIGPYGS